MSVLQASVNSYDDIFSPQGECVTMYMIQVQYSSRTAYTIAKRYSDFANLYQSVKDIVPFDYKFPNKSMFNNAAQFTKDRRRKGFDELVHLLARYEPIPDELQTFLELQQRLNGDKALSVGGQSSSGLSSPQKSNSSAVSSVSGKSEQQKDETKNNEEIIARKNLLLLSNYLLKFRALPRTHEVEVDVHKEIHKVFPAMLKSSFRTAALLYLALILFGIIELSSSSYFRILITVVAMTALACFIQIRDAKKSMVVRST
jgi:hypothetical protein